MTNPAGIKGLHHVTAIAGRAAENLEFYTGVLGLRLVKKSVNQDDPGTYHLFYADAEGTPGTDVTFFPWEAMGPGRKGTGLSVELAFAVPPGSLEYWQARLKELSVSVGRPELRFGEEALPFTDPHGLELALVETADTRESAPWERSPVSAHLQILGLHAVRLREADRAATEAFLTDVLGFSLVGEERGWRRHRAGEGGSGTFLELEERPDARRGTWGRGSIHHVAWRVPDEAVQWEVRQRIAEAGLDPTSVIDRFWFRSVYFREPGGALFEIATEGPGFTVDEDPSELGERLVLPPWLEPQRDRIEAVLPVLEPARA